jgi:hypothetical protein
MTRRPAWLALLTGAAAAATVLVTAEQIGRRAANPGGWHLTFAAGALYGAALVGLAMVMLVRTRTWRGAAFLSAMTVWAIGWLAPALAVAPFGVSGEAIVMLGIGLVELPIAALAGTWIFLRVAGWQHPRTERPGGREARRTA